MSDVQPYHRVGWYQLCNYDDSLSAGRKAVYCSDACKMRAYRQRSKCNDVTPLRNDMPVVTRYGCQTTWMDIAS